MTDVRVTGLSELQQFLDQLPSKMEANIIRGALRAGAKPILNAARQNVPVGPPSEKGARVYKLYEGALRDSIRVSGRIDKRNGRIVARIVAGGKTKKTGANVFYAHFIEYGTRPHSLAKNGKGDINHPGITPKPFMRPALDTNASAAVVAAGEYIKKRLATKNGLDTSDITIEDEE